MNGISTDKMLYKTYLVKKIQKKKKFLKFILLKKVEKYQINVIYNIYGTFYKKNLPNSSNHFQIIASNIPFSSYFFFHLRITSMLFSTKKHEKNDKKREKQKRTKKRNKIRENCK